jgi:hypothetical protein
VCLLHLCGVDWIESGISALAGHDEEDEEHADEEVEREIWLNTIQLAVLKAIHELEAIEQARHTIHTIHTYTHAHRIYTHTPRGLEEGPAVTPPPIPIPTLGSQELPLAERMSISETAHELDAKRVQQERPRTAQEDTKVRSLPAFPVLCENTVRRRDDVCILLLLMVDVNCL